MNDRKENNYSGEHTADLRKRRVATSGGDKKALWAIIAILSALILFVILTIIQKNIVNAGEKVNVVVAEKEVPAGVVLTQDFIEAHFILEQRLKSEVPENAFHSGSEFLGMITDRTLSPREVLTANALISEDPYEGIEDPVEVSIEVEKLSHAVAGTIRAGDYVDIKVVVDMSYMQQNSLLDGAENLNLDNISSMYDESAEGESEEGSRYNINGIDSLEWRERSSFDSEDMTWSPTGKYACVTVAKKVRVLNVYTSAGQNTAQVEENGESQIATVLTLVLPRSMEDLVYLALEEGTVLVSRIVPDEESAETLEGNGNLTDALAEQEENTGAEEIAAESEPVSEAENALIPEEDSEANPEAETERNE